MTTEERLIAIETKLDTLTHTLEGNGQPGIIHELKEADKEQGRRISKIEKYVWIAVGLALASGAAGAHIIEAAIR